MSPQHNVGTNQASEGIQFPAASAHVPSPGGRAAHMERVDEYERLAVLREEADTAFSGVILAELIRIAFTIEDSALERIGYYASIEDGIRAAESTVIQYLRAVGRIERNARLEIHCQNAGG
jgi:hypothetical protein